MLIVRPFVCTDRHQRRLLLILPLPCPQIERSMVATGSLPMLGPLSMNISASATVSLGLLSVLIVSGCGYQLVGTRDAALPVVNLKPVVNLTASARASVDAQRALLSRVRHDPGANYALEAIIRPGGTEPMAYGDDGFGAMHAVRVVVEVNVFATGDRQWKSGREIGVGSFTGGQNLLQTRLARQDAFQRALREAILRALLRVEVYLKTIEESRET